MSHSPRVASVGPTSRPSLWLYSQLCQLGSELFWHLGQNSHVPWRSWAPLPGCHSVDLVTHSCKAGLLSTPLGEAPHPKSAP